VIFFPGRCCLPHEACFPLVRRLFLFVVGFLQLVFVSHYKKKSGKAKRMQQRQDTCSACMRASAAPPGGQEPAPSRSLADRL
jgi:hypothetical protein